MAIRRKVKRRKEKKGFIRYFASLGFSGWLAIHILLFLAVGLAGSFYLVNESIRTGYTGALVCWTVVFAPVDIVCSIALSKIVHKSEAENVGGDGNGIKFVMAMSDVVDDDGSSWESSAI